MSFNTVPPNDYGFWELVDSLVQQEPVGAGEPEMLGLLASVGIVKDKAFAPDARMRTILEEAVQVGNATARTIAFSPRAEEGFAYYPGSAWINMLFAGGYQFLDPPPAITPDGAVAVAGDGARKLNSRISFLYPATGVTPAMCMRLTGIGSQYLIAMRDANGHYLDGGTSYRLTLAAGHPRVPVLVRRPLRPADPGRCCRPASPSQTSAASPAGSRRTPTGPPTSTWAERPGGQRGNWLETVPGKGFFAILRLYSPLPPTSTSPGGPARSSRSDHASDNETTSSWRAPPWRTAHLAPPTGTCPGGPHGVAPRSLAGEVSAGITLLALAVPLNIGYAQITGLRPTAGTTR